MEQIVYMSVLLLYCICQCLVNSENFLHYSVSNKVLDSLYINNSGPAAIDSEIVFVAHLTRNYNGSVQPSAGIYNYTWFNTASNTTDSAFGTATVNLTKVFSQFLVPSSGNYTMHLYVFELVQHVHDEQLKLKPIANGSTQFSLEDDVGMITNFWQPSKTHKSLASDTFLQGLPIHVEAHVRDLFTCADYEYNWLVDEVFVKRTSSPLFNITFDSDRTHSVGVKVNVTLNVKDEKGVKRTVSRMSQTIRHKLVIMDPITRVEIKIDSSAETDKDFSAMISCSGSGPYRISWNITGPSHTNDTSVVYHGFVETDDCRQGFWYIFRSPGHYILSTTIENDVDAVDNEFSIHAVQRNAGSSIEGSAIVFVMSIIVAAVVLTAVGVAFCLSRREARVESANFDFRSSMCESENHVLMRPSQLVKKLAELWPFCQKPRDGFEMQRIKRTVIRYDSTNDEQIDFR